MTAPAGPCQDPGGCLGVPDPQVAERRGLQRPGLRPLLLDHASAAQVRRGQIHLGAWLIPGGREYSQCTFLGGNCASYGVV